MLLILYKITTCRYLNCRAAPVSDITLLASARDFEAFCSPSAAITLMDTKKEVYNVDVIAH